MTDLNYFSSEDNSFTLKAALLGEQTFLGFFLEQLLQKQGCKITNQPQGLDYVFFLWSGQNELVAALALALKTKAKLLIQLPLSSLNLLHSILTVSGLEQIDYRVVITSDIFGPKMPLDSYDQLLNSLNSNRDWLFVTDAVYGMAKAMFTSGTGGKVFWLGRHNPPYLPNDNISLLSGWLPRVSFEYGLSQTKEFYQKRPPTISEELNQTIDKNSVESKNKLLLNFNKESSLPPLTKQFFTEKYNQSLKDERQLIYENKLKVFKFSPSNSPGIRPLFADSNVQAENINSLDSKPIDLVTVSSKKINKNFISNKKLLLLILILIMSPLVFIGLNLYFFTSSIKNCQQYLLKGDFNQANNEAIKSKHSIDRLIPVSNTSSEILMLVNLSVFANKIQQYQNLAITTADLLMSLSGSGQSAQKLADLILNKSAQSGGEKQLMIDLTNSLAEDYYDLSYMQIYLKGSRWESQIGDLTTIKTQIGLAQQATTVLPDVLGLYQQKNYLVLLQNNSELRPTGGFIGSYALITFDKAKMTDFQVQDVYWADGQLQGHVEPPAKLKQYLGEASWYLRDSNWDPDFPTSASRAAWFLEKETGRSVDGVIGVNMYLAQDLLASVGEVNLVDFNEKITAENLFERSEYHSETNFFPGSTQKQDFLGSLARSLFEQLKSTPAKTSVNLAQSFSKGLKQKDLSFYFKNKNLESQAIAFGWAGELRRPLCSENNCLIDSLMIVDTNVGVNKANYFIKRTINQTVNLDTSGTPTEKTVIKYINNSQSAVFPAGQYKNYLRLYLPEKAVLDYIQIKNRDGGIIRSLTEKDVDLSVEHQHQVIGLLIEVPIQDQRTIEVSYRLSSKVTPGQSKYIFALQKQPGIIDDSFNFNFITGSNITINSVLPVGKLEKNSFNIQPRFDHDWYWEFNLQR